MCIRDRMHVDGLLDSPEYSSDKVVGGRPEADEIGASHVLSERRRREKLNKRFMILKSIVPSISKVVKNSVPKSFWPRIAKVID
jgi:hypothetical protein